MNTTYCSNALKGQIKREQNLLTMYLLIRHALMQYTQMEQARYWPFQVYEVPVTTLPAHVNAMSVAITEGYRLTIQAFFIKWSQCIQAHGFVYFLGLTGTLSSGTGVVRQKVLYSHILLIFCMHIFGKNTVQDNIRSPTYSMSLLNFHKAKNKRQADSESLSLYVSISFFTLLFQLSRNSTSQKRSRHLFSYSSIII